MCVHSRVQCLRAYPCWHDMGPLLVLYSLVGSAYLPHIWPSGPVRRRMLARSQSQRGKSRGRVAGVSWRGGAGRVRERKLRREAREYRRRRRSIRHSLPAKAGQFPGEKKRGHDSQAAAGTAVCPILHCSRAILACATTTLRRYCLLKQKEELHETRKRPDNTQARRVVATLHA